jgi:hypothetical protein
MGVLDETRFVERLQFFDGQRLFASDLQGIEAFNREMRWLHNRSLHQPGVGSGFAVHGKKGDRTVTLGPGYAIDSRGREIVLTETPIEPLQIPPVAGENDGRSVFYDLTVSYPDDADLEEAEFREGICDSRGVVRLREAPVLCWVRLQRDEHGNLLVQSATLATRIVEGLAIVLARIEVLNCQLERDVSTAERRTARLKRQPQVAAGTETPEWKFPQDPQLAQVDLAAEPTITSLVLEADIDTTSAGFVNTPQYTARIVGDRLISIVIAGVEIVLLIDAVVTILPGARPTGFTLRALLIGQILYGQGQKVQMDRAMFGRWQVEWMAVEG